ncbi:hypothetical protein DICSQDRAFT_169736 [Dichomitus squalens LYAD-421 SS1]|uniref:DUF6593 domain-containing protein n=1 Tax=Dichomitus squalens (strain LYAD-421) TaxID=732165 RepID=R7T0I3_DICSQ|nr:uncharacterized protein DICSQDRAFT_169736 [Dichomitus squalens LYAD-421 SS1]EJF61718.1 hypothetical protein DICSQDRAFT_169736 [Dichomitus squalens LYAD-421 SS1]
MRHPKCLAGLNVTFLNDSPFSSAVIDSKSGKLLYSISTQTGDTARNTTVSNSQGEVVATREQSWWPGGRGYDNVKVHGQRCTLEHWLPRRKRAWAFTASVWILPEPNGDVYHWQSLGEAFKLLTRSTSTVHGQLVNPRTNEILAQSHPTHHYGGTKLSLDVSHDVLHMLDTIIFSFVVLEGSRIAPVCTESKRRGEGARSSRTDKNGHRRALSEFNGVERVGTLDADTGVTTRTIRVSSV